MDQDTIVEFVLLMMIPHIHILTQHQRQSTNASAAVDVKIRNPLNSIAYH